MIADSVLLGACAWQFSGSAQLRQPLVIIPDHHQQGLFVHFRQRLLLEPRLGLPDRVGSGRQQGSPQYLRAHLELLKLADAEHGLSKALVYALEPAASRPALGYG